MPRFDATIEAADRGGAVVRVPPDVVAALGGGGRIKVVAAFDGVDYRGSVVTMGGAHVIGLLKAIREQLGKGPGDSVSVTVEPDTADRVVELPSDLLAALDAAGRGDAFAALSYSKQRQAVAGVEAAKKVETREKRIAELVDGLG